MRKATLLGIKSSTRVAPLREIDEIHCHDLAKSFHSYKCDYSCGMITVYFSSTINAKGAAYSTAVQHVDRMKLPKDSCRTEKLYGRQGCRSVKLLRGKEGA